MNNFYIKNMKYDKNVVDDISRKLGITKLVSTVLVNRGLTEIEECRSFLNPKLENMHDPYLLKDMDKTVDRIINAIDKKENIWIYGDYDVDGVTSMSLLKLFLEECGANVNYYIPNRFTEGYGININAIESIYKAKGDLIVSVDCGITSIQPVEYCKSLGMDIIITDHHECQAQLPDAFAVINPKRDDCKYPFKLLAGVGVAFKLVQALSKAKNIKIEYEKYLPIVAFGTVADIVALRGENRIIVRHGLEMLRNTENKGLKALIEVCGLADKKITSGHVGFMLAPRVNACGRLDSAKYGVELLTCNDDIRAKQIAKMLNEENLKRQKIEADILYQAEKIVEENIDLEKERMLVIASENWNHGVIGIVSSRITEKYYRPSILISIDGDEGRGSARSIKNFDMFSNLNKCKDLFEKFGGHEQAAGLSIRKENIDSFRTTINDIAKDVLDSEDLKPEIRVDMKLTSSDINIDVIEQLSLLEPFGMGNASPVFMSKDAKIIYLKAIGKEGKHLKITFNVGGNNVDAIYFNKGNLKDELSKTEKVDIIYSMEINKYNNIIKPQLVLKKVVLKHDILEELNNNYLNTLNLVLNSKIQYNKEKNLNLPNTYTDDKKVIELLNDDVPTAVIVNNYYYARFLIKELLYQGRNFFKKTSIEYGSLHDCTKPNIVMVNPVDFDLEKYSRVIIYDDLYDIIYNNIYKAIDNKEIIAIKSKEKMFEFNILLNNIIPTIEEMRTIYKYFLVHKKKTEYNVNHVINDIRKLFNMKINRFKLELSLYIFKDCDLVMLDKRNDNFIAEIITGKRGIDILNNNLYRTYMDLKDSLINN